MMFDFADTDGDGQLSFGEFLKVINPPKPDKEGVVEEKRVVIEKEPTLEGESQDGEEENKVGAEIPQSEEDKEDVKVVKFEDEIGNGNTEEKNKDEKDTDEK